MKKLAFTLTLLAASGAAFSQSATLSGSYVFGYQSNKVAGVRTAGMGTDTAAIALTATEDLGGGLKASARVSLGGMMRDGAGTGEDASITLSGGFGTLNMTTQEVDNGLQRAYAGADAFVIGLDGKVHGGKTTVDFIGYTTPQLAPGLTVGFSATDRGATTSTGLGAGLTGVAVNLPGYTINVSYKANSIDARTDYTIFGRQGDTAVASNTNKNRFRISGNYDFGVAKVGLGYYLVNRTTGTSVKTTTIGVSAPMGATTVGLVYEKNVDKGVTVTGMTLGAKYNLSKRTFVNAGYAQWKKSGAATTDSSFRVLVGHNF